MAKKWKNRKGKFHLKNKNRCKRHRKKIADQSGDYLELNVTSNEDEITRTYKMRADDIFIKVEKGSAVGILRKLNNLGAQLIRETIPGEVLQVTVPEGVDLFEFIEQVELLNGVAFAEPIPLMKACAYYPTDPYFPFWYELLTYDRDSDMDSVFAWDYVRNASGITIAIVDNGKPYYNRQYSSVPSSEIKVFNFWNNSGEIEDDQIDNDGNGWVDDVYGINAYSNNRYVEAPKSNHARVIACLAAANMNDGIVGIGTGPCARMMSVYIGNYDMQVMPTGIRYAVDNGADVINFSYSSDMNSNVISDEIEYAKNKGVIFVTSSDGNMNVIPTYPAGLDLDNIVTVGSYCKGHSYVPEHGYGNEYVDIAAPGSHLMVQEDNHLTMKNMDPVYYEGSSYAAALVSGAIATIKTQFPGLDYQQIISRLYAGADRFEEYEDYVIEGRRLNMLGIVQSPFSDAVSTGEGDWQESWFGIIDTSGYPWIEHKEHGFLNTTSISESNVWFWDYDIAWFWTNSTYYPYVWSQTYSTWLYYLEGTKSPRWFYRYDLGEWMEVHHD